MKRSSAGAGRNPKRDDPTIGVRCLGNIYSEADLIQELLCDSRKIIKGLCSDDDVRNLILDAKEHVAATFVGDPNAVSAELPVIVLILGFLEFKNFRFVWLGTPVVNLVNRDDHPRSLAVLVGQVNSYLN